jgi:hypothetical protein
MNMGADGNRTTSQMSRDSMQMSEASRGSVFSILSDDSQDMEMAGVLQGPRQNSSLYGTIFEDEFALVTTKSDIESTFQSTRGGNNQRSGPSPPPMPPTRPFPQTAPVPGLLLEPVPVPQPSVQKHGEALDRLDANLVGAVVGG